MFINQIPGRYTYINGNYIFEKGYINEYSSCKLKVQSFVNLLRNTEQTVK